MFRHRISGESPDDFPLFIDDEIEFEGQSCQPSSIDNLFIKGVSFHHVHFAASMTHPGVMMVGYRPVRANPGHDNFASASVSGDGMRHTFSNANNQIGESHPTVDFHKRPPMGFPNGHIIRGMGIVGKDMTLEAGEKFFSNLFFKLFRCENGMGPHGTDSGDPFVGDPRAVQAVQDLGQSKMDRSGSLQVIKEQNHFHPRTCQFFNLW